MAPTRIATEGGSRRYRLIDEAASFHKTIFIKRKRCRAVLISEDSRRSIRKTICLLDFWGKPGDLP